MREKRDLNSKKMTKMLLILSFVFIYPSVSIAQFSGGNGSEGSPYIITTAAQLAQLATYVNEEDENYNDKYYKLGNDIDLTEYLSETGAGYNEGNGWIPIGAPSSVFGNNFFKGNFDGNNKKITGMKFNTFSNNKTIGLFGLISNGTIKNLGVENIGISIVDIGGMYNCIGGVVGSIDSTSVVENCYSTGSISINSSTIADGIRVGGVVGSIGTIGIMVGHSNGVVSNCYSTVSIHMNINNFVSVLQVGGVAGICYGINSYENNASCNLLNCYSTGTVKVNLTISSSYSSTSMSSNIGGVAGYCRNGVNVLNCYSTGIIEGNIVDAYAVFQTSSNVGGVVGYCEHSKISNCHSTGTISSILKNQGHHTVSCAGGVVGRRNTNPAKVLNSYSTGSVSSVTTGYLSSYNSSASTYSGGIIGYEENYGGCSNCYSTSEVNSISELTNSSTSNDMSYSGGITGSNYGGSHSNCYSTGGVSSYGKRVYIGGITGINNYKISNCAALNSSLNAAGDEINFGRITGKDIEPLSNNIATVCMLNPDGDIIWENIGATNLDGEDAFTVQIIADGTLGGRFTSDNGWTTQNGKLPGFGTLVDIPEHFCDIVNVDNLVTKEKKIKIYPNPTKDVLYVECENVNVIKFYDMLGKEALTQMVNGKTEINIKHLSKGIYSINVISEGKFIGNSKIVKQ